MIMNPWTAALVVGTIVIMAIELAGFMGLAGLKLNPISCVSIISAVGIGELFIQFGGYVILCKVKARQKRHKIYSKTIYTHIKHPKNITIKRVSNIKPIY
jgi:hypothetical protein